nr:MAG TPA: hypothetical protein [Caudoviricetes sp.]DAE81543.1 MAG TPA: hypothetical protein [Caudoviricetes sp.]
MKINTNYNSYSRKYTSQIIREITRKHSILSYFLCRNQF